MPVTVLTMFRLASRLVTARGVCRLSAYTKPSTGLVGLAVEPEWRSILTTLYKQQLKEVEVRRTGVRMWMCIHTQPRPGL